MGLSALFRRRRNRTTDDASSEVEDPQTAPAGGTWPASEAFDDEGSVTIQIRRAQQGDAAATKELYDRFNGKLQRWLQGTLKGRDRAMADEEDVAIISFADMFQKLLHGDLPELGDRYEFWKLLLTVAGRNMSDHKASEKRMKRGGGRVVNEAAFVVSDEASSHTPISQAAGREPEPCQHIQILENCEKLLDALDDDELRSIVAMRAAGDTSEVIAHKLGMGKRTVERRLAVVRDRWRGMIEAEA